MYSFMKKILSLTALLLCTMQLTAANIDVATAQATAQRFMHEMAANGRFKAPALGANVTLIHAEASHVAPGQSVYYIFNTSDSYIIVSGDDRAEEVLAYGDSPLDMYNIPDGMRYWLDCYKQELEYLQAHPDLQVERPHRAPARSQASVEPLLKTMWDQSAPYYNQCPTSNGQHCLTGCAATSLSMILNYWRFPDGPTPAIESYRTSSLNMYVDGLQPTTFDWDNILDRYRGNYNNAQANAVAWLMRYVGQAEHMDYTPSASGVQAEDIIRAVRVFGFDRDATLVYRSSYSDEQWAAMIQEELRQGRPLEYCGYAAMSGHAFNVDGYDADNDKYHINWGWGGSANGYCALNAFNGGGMGFNRGQLTIIGLEPPISVPTIKVNLTRMSATSFVDRTAVISFMVKGRQLTGNVMLSLNDSTGTFALRQNQLDLTNENVSRRIDVAYTPDAVGEHTATITLSSEGAKDVTITVNGKGVLETYDPVMLTASDVDDSSFQVNWQDNTPAHNVVCYNLETANVAYSELCMTESFANVSSSSSECSSHLDDIMANTGWTGSKVFKGDGYLRLGNSSSKGWLQSPELDMRDSYGQVTVRVRAKSVGTYDEALLKISCGENDTTFMVFPEEQEYCVLLPCPTAKDVKVKLANSVATHRVALSSVEVYAGDDYTPLDVSTIVEHYGITGNSFKVNVTTPGTYAMRVQAVYTDGTVSPWSNLTRVEILGSIGDLNNDGIINIADINVLINVVLGNTASRRTHQASDLNRDGVTNIADLNSLIHIILNNN